MNQKIIANTYGCPDVLLYRSGDQDDIEKVIIQAIGYIDNEKDSFVAEEIIFATALSAQRFIIDYSSESAEQWCIDKKITV